MRDLKQVLKELEKAHFTMVKLNENTIIFNGAFCVKVCLHKEENAISFGDTNVIFEVELLQLFIEFLNIWKNGGEIDQK